jgi:hypothetical protein
MDPSGASGHAHSGLFDKRCVGTLAFDPAGDLVVGARRYQRPRLGLERSSSG